MQTKKRAAFWVWIACALALLFTGYVLADSFLIARVEQSADQTDTALRSEITSQLSAFTADSGVLLPEKSENTVYSDENIQIALTQYREYDTDIYVAEVWVTSAEYLKTAFAHNSYGKNVTAKTSEIAQAQNAILAINGDFYGARDNGYVIRNGVLYRSSAGRDTDVLCIYADGSFEIINSSEASAQTLVDQGVLQALSFGPGLLENGEITVSSDSEVGKAMNSNPRTAIGQISNLHYVFVVSDGRTSRSEGLTLYELASFMQKLGVETAYNLDGGGSSTMVLNGQVINNPTTGGSRIKERSVSDIVYIGI